MAADECPACCATIPRPELCSGMWSGAQENGLPAGGSFYQADCPQCGIHLVAYADVFDDRGNIPHRAPDWGPALDWQQEAE
jgi:hypothetical protein